jgi:hypothetical protein
MPLLLLTRIGTIFCFVLISNFSFGQKDTIRYVKSPYRTEYTPHFKLSTFIRGFSDDSLKLSLDELESKPRTTWSRKDSLQFAEISLKTGNTALSEYYFNHLSVRFKTEEKYWYDQLMIHYLNKDFKRGLREITIESPMILEFSRMYFIKRIFQAQVEQKQDPEWYETNIVFDWTSDTLLKEMDRNDHTFQQMVTEPLRNLEFVLKHIISFVHYNDAVLASACREMGHLIFDYFNYSHTFIAYSMARHYNKKDKALLEDLRNVKALLTTKKYKIPNFRKYFPRIEKHRFEYEVLKEKIIFEQNDTTVYVLPETMKKKDEPILKFPRQYIVLGGLALMIILLALILKTKKK